MNDLVLKNIDKIVTGNINSPIAKGDTVVVRNGLIEECDRVWAINRLLEALNLLYGREDLLKVMEK